MQYQVLARKWRPKNFGDVIGQDHITRSLKNALISQKLAHAYLFTGSRGTGKTSIARIFAKSLRCTEPSDQGDPCNTCSSCLDFNTSNPMNILEIDGASNNSVENVRDLISEVDYLPSEGQYKVYIIDEVHMLSVSAFNALLKTLEEPPAHVIFILATTEPQKLLDTVLSRCQRFDFRLVQTEELISHIKKISDAEGIRFQNERLLKEICKRGKGSVRDTLSLLDQVLCFTSSKEISEEVLVMSLGLARDSVIKELMVAILQGDCSSISSLYRSLIHENIPVKNIISPLIEVFYELIQSPDKDVLRDVSTSELFWIFETLVRDAKWGIDSLDPDRVVEIILQKISLRRDFFTQKAVMGNQKVAVSLNTVESISEKHEEVRTDSMEPVDSQEEEAFEEEIDEDYAYSPLDAADPDQKVSVFSDPAKVIMEEKKSPKSTKTWSDFLVWLNSASPSIASNLDQGNLLSELDLEAQRLSVVYGFSPESKVFYEFLKEDSIKKKIVQYLAEYFELEVSCIELRLSIEDDEQFFSQAQLREKEEKKVEDDKREQLLSHQTLKHAEHIFNSKIDKTIIN